MSVCCSREEIHSQLIELLHLGNVNATNNRVNETAAIPEKKKLPKLGKSSMK